MTSPQSGWPSQATVSGNGKVSSRPTPTKNQPARNFPTTACAVEKGRVSSNSQVAEEGLQAGLVAFEEIVEKPRQADAEQDEDDEEDVGDGRTEVASEFALK